MRGERKGKKEKGVEVWEGVRGDGCRSRWRQKRRGE